jgi:hypothetical protein
MGLFSFFKRSGKRLKSEEPTADDLKKEVADLGLDAEGLDIVIEGDKVKVTGNAVSEEMREKVILAVGNVDGVAEVEDDAGEANFHTVEKGDTLWGLTRVLTPENRGVKSVHNPCTTRAPPESKVW